MFHRVKSETVSEPKPAPEEAAEEQNSELELEAQEVEQDDQEEESAEAQTETQDTEEDNTAPEGKDNQDMTQQSANTASEEKPSRAKARPDIPAGTYAQSSQSAVRPGGYPGAYPGMASYAPAGQPAVAPAQDAEYSDRTLTIGAGITMSGEIEACDNLVVEGTVEAALKGARNLDIAESGTFYGTVEIEQAIIAGRFEGDLTVNGRLVLKTGGVITGSIAYGELEVEAGAVIDGRLTPVAVQAQEAPQPAAAPAPKVKPAAPKAKVAKNEEAPEAANSEGALFAAKA